MTDTTRFEQLIAEGKSVPVDGWDFSWFEGRATEQRPPWGYQRMMTQRVEGARAALDLQTGGGEVLAAVRQPPPVLRATESWPPNIAIARSNLADLGVEVIEVADDAPLPFADASFDLVVSRHPTVVLWDEIARVLEPGGHYLSQQVGMASMHELSAAMLGPFSPGDDRSPDRARADAERAGLKVSKLQIASSRTEFSDIASVVVYLGKVIWIVPGFTVERYRQQLQGIHEQIEHTGSYLAHSTRFLIEVSKP